MKKDNCKIYFLVLIVAFFGCDLEKGASDNYDYLKSMAQDVQDYQKKWGELPEGLDDVYSAKNGKSLWHRGDINGATLSYYKIDERAFFIRSVGVNRKEERGLGDDVQVISLDQKIVSRDEVMRYIQEHHPDTFEVYQGIFGY